MGEGESLVSFILEHIQQLPNNCVLVVTSKVVSLSESRVVHQWDEASRDALVQNEADAVFGTTYPPLTIKNGVYAAASGIDVSNGNGALILQPTDAWKTAHDLHSTLKRTFKLRNFGVIVSDSMPLPGKKGVVSMSIGSAGFLPVKDYRGTRDIFGKKFVYSSANCADALAAAAGIMMGEGNEQQPLAIISRPPVTFFSKRTKNSDVIVKNSDDIYASLAQGKIKHLKKGSV